LDWVFIISQILALIGFAVYALSFWQKDRRKILLLEVLECFFHSIHYFLLGAYTGGFLNIIGMARSGSFIYKDKNKFMKTYTLPAIFLLIYVVNAILTWQGFITLLPTAGSIIICLTIWQHNTKNIRRNSVVVQILWLIYGISIGSYMVVASEIALLISTITAIVRLDILHQKPEYKIRMNMYLSALEKIYDKNSQNFVYDKHAIKNPDYIKFVCLKGNKPLGYIAVYPHANFMEKQGFPKYEPISQFSIFIWHIVVRREYQRKGVATALLEEIKKVYEGYEIYSILDSRNNPSVYFHSLNGFIKTFDFQRVFYGKLEKFDLMQLKSTIKEKVQPQAEISQPIEKQTISNLENSLTKNIV